MKDQFSGRTGGIDIFWSVIETNLAAFEISDHFN